MASQYEDKNVTTLRKGEQEIPITFRTNCFFAIGVKWYFSTREGIHQGPFENKDNAQIAKEGYIRDIQYLN